MLFEISLEEEGTIEAWMKQHITDCHWEFSTNDRLAYEKNENQYSFMIWPSRSDMNNYNGDCRCNYCGERYRFREKI